MPFLNKAFQLIFSQRLKRIRFATKHPAEVQDFQLKELLATARNTAFGTQYNFKAIRNIQAFQDAVPIQKYEELYKNVEQIRKGEKNLLWPGATKWFAKSSGTTNEKSKFIPVTNKSLRKCHYQGGIDVVILYQQNYPNHKIFDGKTLTLGGSHQIDYFDKNARSGDLSAIMLQNIPIWADMIRTPKRSIALLANWEEKLEKLSNSVIKENVTALAGVPSWNMVLLKHILDITGKKNILEVWPNIELFMHGGVNFTPYREQYNKLIPSLSMHYMETYNASEGFFAIQDDPADPAMLLMLDYGIFYEFIPLTEYAAGKCNAIPLADVETGVNYAVIITTNGGLWRYVIGDTVMFTSIKPYKILITGRTKHFINAFGEELIIDNAERALIEACKNTGAIIHEYTAAPVFMSSEAKGCHEWLIEFEVQPDDLNKFSAILDSSLMQLNSDYEAKRYKDITLVPPVVKSVAQGTFYKWFTLKGKLGGQNKIPRLSNDRKYVEELLSLD